MRRFFRVVRDEDCGQIQYLTAKCVRLSQEKAVLQRELLVSEERQQALQEQMESLSVRVCRKEQLCVELSVRYEQLRDRFQQQQERAVSVTEDRWRGASLLEQVSWDLQQLQGSETQLMGLVDELHQEAQRRAQRAEGLEAQLHEEAQSKAQLVEDLQMQLSRKCLELEALQTAHEALRQDLREQHSAHRRTEEELLGTLREAAEQLEWMCEQQRRWTSCVRRFKDCLSGEKESLELQVNRLQQELDAVRKTVNSESCRRWDDERKTDLRAEVNRWRRLYEDLLELTTQQRIDSNPDEDPNTDGSILSLTHTHTDPRQTAVNPSDGGDEQKR